MKKIITVTTTILTPFALFAQDVYVLPDGKSLSRQFFEIPATGMAFCLMGIFILTIIRWFLDFRFKSKLINKEVPEGIMRQLLQSDKTDSKTQAMKWFLILAGIAVGLTLISLTLPVGVHSLAIMAFSIAFSFLGYYFFMKRSEKP